jgi:hypothetical protein
MPYASLLPRQKHLLADAFDLFLRLGLEFRARRCADDDLSDDDDLAPLRDMDDDDVIDDEDWSRLNPWVAAGFRRVRASRSP